MPIRYFLAAALLGAAIPATAQAPQVRPIGGTRVDVVATGEVTRTPDIVLIDAGISSQAATATEAILVNRAAMDRMRDALRRAGIDPRDVQTSSVSLDAQWRHQPSGAQQFAGYRAEHRLSVRFRDAANAGRILDTLVTAGATEIRGPDFDFADSEAAYDEARTQALERARRRAELYARSLGMRVVRVLAVTEGAGHRSDGFRGRAAARRDAASSNIALGEETLASNLTVSFELE